MRFYTTEALAALVLALAPLSACDSGPGTVLSLLSAEVSVDSVVGICKGRTASVSVRLAVDGYSQQALRDDDSFLGTSPGESEPNALLLLAQLQVDPSSTPNDTVNDVEIVRPASTLGLVGGESYVLDVPVVAADGATSYRQIPLVIPICS